MPFRTDFDWQRAFVPHVVRIVANYLIAEAPFEEDARHNTDLLVLKAETTRVACRLRRFDQLSSYGDQFTLRASRPNGCDTELTKVLRGWGDYIFYGFVNHDESDLAAWLLGDLNEFRIWHHRELVCGRTPWLVKHNGDGSSTFHAYRISDLPNAFVRARRRPERSCVS